MAYQERGPVMTREKATRLALLTGILIASVTPQRAFAQIDKEKQTASAHARRAPILKSVPLGVLQKKSNVPGSWQQGMLLSPQAVSALDISADGRFVGITTLAFRHDRNFWVLSAEGKVLGARFVEPWAPFQVAVLPGGKAFGVGLAYSRFTDPSPTVSFLHGERNEETALVDQLWDMGWLRYGQGDWRTGWPGSLVGDLIVRAEDSVFTVVSHDAAWRLKSDGSREKSRLVDQRPFRMTASGDGHVLALGYLVPDVHGLNEKIRQRVHLPPAQIFTVALDHNRTHVYERRTGLFVPVDPSLEGEVRAQAVENLACKIFSGEWNNAAQGKPVSIRTIRSKIHCACGLVSGLYDEFADLRRPAAERITEMADFQSEGILQEFLAGKDFLARLGCIQLFQITVGD